MSINDYFQILFRMIEVPNLFQKVLTHKSNSIVLCISFNTNHYPWWWHLGLLLDNFMLLGLTKFILDNKQDTGSLDSWATLAHLHSVVIMLLIFTKMAGGWFSMMKKLGSRKIPRWTWDTSTFLKDLRVEQWTPESYIKCRDTHAGPSNFWNHSLLLSYVMQVEYIRQVSHNILHMPKS